VDTITVLMPQIDSFSVQAGGSEITSYNLEYNMGSGSQFYEVTGYTVEQLQTKVTVSTLPGVTYSFRYRVKNIYGFSHNFSPLVQIKSATAPEMPSNLVTSISSRNLLIKWTAESANYDPITMFEIEIQNSELEWIPETTTCEGADETIKQTT